MRSIQHYAVTVLTVASCLLVTLPLTSVHGSGPPPSSAVAPIFRSILPQLAQAQAPVYLPSWLPTYKRLYASASLQGGKNPGWTVGLTTQQPCEAWYCQAWSMIGRTGTYKPHHYDETVRLGMNGIAYIMLDERSQIGSVLTWIHDGNTYTVFEPDGYEDDKTRLAVLLRIARSMVRVDFAQGTGANGRFTSFPVPTAKSLPSDIARGPDGNLWFTEGAGNKIGRITPSGHITEFILPPRTFDPGAITAGPDRALWFTADYTPGYEIGRVTPGGQITSFALPIPRPMEDASIYPTDIVAGPDGDLWFTLGDVAKIGRITPTGHIAELAVPRIPNGGYGLMHIVAGSDGSMWADRAGGTILRIMPSGRISQFSVPTGPNGELGGIAAASDGALWFTEWMNNKIGRIAQSGRITQFALPTVAAPVTAITGAANGAAWFIEEGPNKLGQITPSGTVREYPLPRNLGRSQSSGVIVRGPDGNLWFTDPGTNSIVRWTPPTTVR